MGGYLVKKILLKYFFISFFETVPEFHEVEIADEGSCSGDLNFDLYGFRINGNVLNGRESALKLGLHGENGNLIEETNTDANGQYSFIAKPGESTK
jgi:hypothetical protein